MISILTYIDNKNLEKAIKEVPTRDRSNALGKVGEQIVKGIFKGAGEAATSGGKADITGVPVANIARLISRAEGGGVASESIIKNIEETMGVGSTTLDIEAKATDKQLAPKGLVGALKLSQATPSVSKSSSSDADYIKRQKALIVDIIRLGLGNKALASTIDKSFSDLLAMNYNSQDVDKLNALISSSLTPVQIETAFKETIQNHWDEFMSGPFGQELKNKARNLTVQVNLKAPQARTLNFFQTFIGLTFQNSDIRAKKDGKTYKFYFSTAFEQKLLKETRSKLEKNAFLVVEKVGRLGFEAGARTDLGAILKGVNSLDKIRFSVSVPSGGSIPIGYGLNISGLVTAIGTQLPKSLLIKRGIKKTGQFVSAVTMTRLLQDVTKRNMRKGSGPASPPVMTYRSGRFVDNLRVAQVNYKNKVIRYYLDPIYLNNEDHGYEVSELVEGSLRTITQNLYKRNFKLIRGNI